MAQKLGNRMGVTPVRRALKASSFLQGKVRDGLDAVKSAHHKYIDERIRPEFADTLDLDVAMKGDNPQENRWDYLLGHREGDMVVGLEPHSAKKDQITTIINKKAAAVTQLGPHLEKRGRVAAWLWVASGAVYFADTETARRRLDQNGIKFVGKKVLAKHLPQAGGSSQRNTIPKLKRRS